MGLLASPSSPEAEAIRLVVEARLGLTRPFGPFTTSGGVYAPADMAESRVCDYLMGLLASKAKGAVAFAFFAFLGFKTAVPLPNLLLYLRN